jgi:hypothetical protein
MFLVAARTHVPRACPATGALALKSPVDYRRSPPVFCSQARRLEPVQYQNVAGYQSGAIAVMRVPPARGSARPGRQLVATTTLAKAP